MKMTVRQRWVLAVTSGSRPRFSGSELFAAFGSPPTHA